MDDEKFAESVRMYCTSFGTWKTARRLANIRVKSLTGLSLERYSDATRLTNAVENINDAVESFMETRDTSKIHKAISEITIEFLNSNLIS